MDRNIVNLLNGLLTERDLYINFVDIGSRNGILELADISGRVDAFGFEPNQEEYDKLISGKTDAAAFGVCSPQYHSVVYSPYALSNFSGDGDFYITKGPGGCGMLEPDLKRLSEIKWKGEEYSPNMAEAIFAVEKKVSVNTNTLVNFVSERNLKFIDYLKIDVEGSEHEVLEGAGEILRNTGVIKVEVCFIPFRKNQKLFSEVDLFLRKYGFDLLKYEIVPEQIGLKEKLKPWSFFPAIGVPEKYGQPLQADAVYVNRSVINNDRCLAQAAVLIEKKYLDEAIFVLKQKLPTLSVSLVSALQSYRGEYKDKVISFLFENVRRVVRALRKIK